MSEKKFFSLTGSDYCNAKCDTQVVAIKGTSIRKNGESYTNELVEPNTISF